MANDDKIYAAYSGELGEKFQKETHRRINWILEQASDSSKILDIGCSQGIISLLLAEKGKKVKGIDIQKEAIDFAKELLSEDYKDLSDKVEFECIDFFEYSSKEKEKYDTILMTEVIEHLLNPNQFVDRAYDFLIDNGKLIVTVPFGISEHPDHESTFYLTSIIEIVNKRFNIDKIYFMTNWIGITGIKAREYKKFDYKKDLIIRLEGNFHSKDYEMTQRIKNLYTSNIEANKKYRESTQGITRLKETNNQLISENKELKLQLDKANKKHRESTQNYTKIKENNLILASKNLELSKEIENINENYRKVIEERNSFKEKTTILVSKNQEIQASIKKINNKYKMLIEENDSLKEKNDSLKEKNDSLKEKNDSLKEKNDNLKEKNNIQMMEIQAAIDKDVELLEKLDKYIERLKIQNDILSKSNEEYKRKLSIITDTWYGKILIKMYKLLKRSKNIFMFKK